MSISAEYVKEVLEEFDFVNIEKVVLVLFRDSDLKVYEEVFEK